MKYTIYLALACMGYSCEPVLTLQVATTHAALADSSNYVLLRRADNAEIAAEEIGKVSYQQTGSSIPWSYDEIAGWIRGTAMQNGANLVKVTDYAPYRKNGLAHVAATLYHARDLRPYEREISWSSNRKLTYMDFKGAPDPVAESRSRCQFYPRTLFFCTESWINRGSADSARLLEHEQGNFDLCEIYRRRFWRLEADMQGQRSRAQKTQGIFQQVYSTYREKKRQYDLDTNHGLDDERQALWTKRIRGALVKSDEDPDPFFVVEKVFSLRQKDSVAKALKPPPGKALVYIIRPKNVSTSPAMRIVYDPLYLCFIYGIGFNINRYTVNVNDTSLGPIEGHSYAYLSVDPGELSFATGMNLESHYRAMFSARKAKKGNDLSIAAQAGKVYYLTLATNATWFGFAAPQLEMVEEAKGRKLLNKCMLSAIYVEPHFQLFDAGNWF
jgi:hypothetical protein